MGHAQSRSGEAIARCATKVADKAKKLIAAHMLEAAPEDMELIDGKFAVRGSPEQGKTLAEVAGAAYLNLIPDDMELGLEETTFFDPENFVFPFGAHACIVDVDGETGKVDVVRYVAVDDCGNPINPLLIDGQVHGGITAGIGQALYERVHYDQDGQLVTGTFVDYGLATAAEMPSFETDRTVTPSPANTLGAKGIGEAGTIAASAAVTNAVIDALLLLGYLHQHAADTDARLAGDRPGQGRCRRMIPAEFDYEAPETLQDAISMLSQRADEDAKLLAGGHSLIPLMKLRLASPGLLIDLRRVPGLHGVQREERPLADRGDDAPRGTGAQRAARNRGCGGGDDRRPAGRNCGTIGGSIATAIRRLICRRCCSQRRDRSRCRGPPVSEHSRPLSCSGTDPETAVAPDEVLTEVRVPALEGWGFSYRKFNRRSEDWQWWRPLCWSSATVSSAMMFVWR